LNFESLTKGRYGQLYIILTHVLFTLVITGLVFSKALLAIGYVGLLALTIPGLTSLPRMFSDISWRPFSWLFLLYGYLMASQIWGGAGWDDLKSLKGMILFPWLAYFFKGHIHQFSKDYTRLFLLAISLASFITVAYQLSPPGIKAFYYSLGLVPEPDKLPDQSKFGWYYAFGDRLQFGYLVAVGIFLVLFKKRPFRPVVAAIIGIILITCFIGLGARGAQIGLILALSFWGGYILTPKLSRWTGLNRSLALGLTTSILLGFFIIGGYMMYLTVEPVKQRYNQAKWEIETYRNKTYKEEEVVYYTTLRRYLSWKHNLTLIRDQPIFGHGVGAYREKMRSLQKAEDIVLEVHSNQQYLYFWVTGGIVSILLFLMSQISFLQRLKNGGYFHIGVAFTLFYVVVFCLDSPLLYAVGNATYFFFFSGLLVMGNDPREE
jgi:O-antigen ligase